PPAGPARTSEPTTRDTCPPAVPVVRLTFIGWDTWLARLVVALTRHTATRAIKTAIRRIMCRSVRSCPGLEIDRHGHHVGVRAAGKHRHQRVRAGEPVYGVCLVASRSHTADSWA